MLKQTFISIVLGCVLHPAFCQSRMIAITIDDLPFVGEDRNELLERIINTAEENETPMTGFVIAANVTPQNWQKLRKFREAGLDLGNHTLSHVNINRVSAATYIQEIDEADKTLAPFMSEPKYFRYPYLAMGEGTKKQSVLRYLAAKNYHIAPVTIDSKDFMFNQLLMSVPVNMRREFLKTLKPCYLNFIWQQTLRAEERNSTNHKPEAAQILLIHANLLNAYVLPDIIHLYRQKGFDFVSLENALKKTKHEPPRPPKSTAGSDETIETFMVWD